MTEHEAPKRVGLIGFGEVGSSLGTGLKSAGATVVAFDKGQQDSPFADLIQKRSRQSGVPLASSMAEVVAASDLLLAAVPGSLAMEAASEAARYLKPGQMYVDMGTASPPVKEKIAELIEAAGAAFVDVAIMGSPLEDKHRIATMASGKEAERYRDLVTPFEMKVTVVGDRPGPGSGHQDVPQHLHEGHRGAGYRDPDRVRDLGRGRHRHGNRHQIARQAAVLSRLHRLPGDHGRHPCRAASPRDGHGDPDDEGCGSGARP